MAKDEKVEAPLTRRLVMKRERVIVIPPGVELTAIDSVKLAESMGLPKSKQSLVREDAWLPVAEFDGATMDAAIVQHTGPAGQPDTKAGVFKAPSLRSWAGGVEMVAPPKPLFEKRRID